MNLPTVVVAGLGDTGILVATRLARTCRVVAVTTRPALVSGQELGMRLANPEQWRRHYFVPTDRFRRLDAVDVRLGRVSSVDLENSTVRVQSVDGDVDEVRYDAFVIATGVSNGFWRHDRVENLETVGSQIADSSQMLASAKVIAVIGGGATGVSVADNLARTGSHDVHLFHSGNEILPEHRSSARRWATRSLDRDGVTIHLDHRAVLPDDRAPESITSGTISWSTGQPPFEADAVVWAVGSVRPHTGFLPSEILDDRGFVRVNRHLRSAGHENVFAIGDVAASDPLRSSARNWGHRVVVANVRSVLRGRASRRRFRAPKYRWGSIIGLQPEGLTVAMKTGGRMRIPRPLAEPLLYGAFVTRGLYGGLRNDSSKDGKNRG
ncbi:MAG: FAD-dependent oxidoreductase [Actinomycetota bacterium]